MKKIRKLKLNQLSNQELTNRQMDSLSGGGTPGTCSCACPSANTDANCSANSSSGYTISKPGYGTAGCCDCQSGGAMSTFNISN